MMQKRRVTSGSGSRVALSKRQQEEKAYRSVHYDDTFWEKEWYLVSERGEGMSLLTARLVCGAMHNVSLCSITFLKCFCCCVV